MVVSCHENYEFYEPEFQSVTLKQRFGYFFTNYRVPKKLIWSQKGDLIIREIPIHLFHGRDRRSEQLGAVGRGFQLAVIIL